MAHDGGRAELIRDRQGNALRYSLDAMGSWLPLSISMLCVGASTIPFLADPQVFEDLGIPLIPLQLIALITFVGSATATYKILKQGRKSEDDARHWDMKARSPHI